MLKVDHHDMYVQNTVLKNGPNQSPWQAPYQQSLAFGNLELLETLSSHGGFQVASGTCLQEIVPKRFVSSQLYTCMKIMCSF